MSDSEARNARDQGVARVSSERGWFLQNLPNLITVLRIALIPFFLAVFITPSPVRSLWAAIIFIIASATDLLDGYVARKMEQVTRLGKLLDPIADKLLVISALILLVQFQRVHAILAILIIGRETAITGVRVIAANQGIIIQAERMGKFKTFLQVMAIILLILDPAFFTALGGIDYHPWARIILWISLVLGLVSAGQYFYRFTQEIRRRI